MRSRYQIWGAIALGVSARLLFAIAPGKTVAAPWSGGSDAPAYVLLAHNVASGRGLTYCGMADAIRPPLYPLLLGLLVSSFGSWFTIAVRLLQFSAGLLAAYAIYAAAKRLWGEQSALLAGAALLLTPTLVYLTGEIITESFATLIVSVYLYLLLRLLDGSSLYEWALIGALVGLGTLLRFNFAVLGIVAVCGAWRKREFRGGLVAAGITTLAAAIVISPWVLRNVREFHGRVLLSAQTGHNMVEGLITPEGRALPGDPEKLILADGWTQGDIETNGTSRLSFPDEGTLNANTTHLAIGLWRKAGVSALPVVLKKLGYFWLQTDQLTWYPGRGHWVRMAGVLVWWLMLGCAIAGWIRLKQENHPVANVLLLYAVLVTVFHIPFVMNTRLGAPFLTPLACLLLSGGVRLLTPSLVNSSGAQESPSFA